MIKAPFYKLVIMEHTKFGVLKQSMKQNNLKFKKIILFYETCNLPRIQ